MTHYHYATTPFVEISGTVATAKNPATLEVITPSGKQVFAGEFWGSKGVVWTGKILVRVHGTGVLVIAQREDQAEAYRDTCKAFDAALNRIAEKN